MPAALEYHEPDVLTILSLSSFLLISNVSNFILDHAIYCGLLGQILVGVAWGTPGGKLLGPDIEHAVVQFGYLGLILLVYEGGVSTSFAAVKANLGLSIGVAATGILLPIAFSFLLLKLNNATPLQAFAAGAALCSTSLGTTFTVLSTSGLTQTRLGTVLSTAAMLDDVVGLIMVQVISDLGGVDTSFSAVTVIRPIAVSVGLVVALVLLCRFIVRLLTVWFAKLRNASPGGLLNRLFSHKKGTAFVCHTTVLIGMVIGSTYAGTSNLFAAYLAGASISWWDSELGAPREKEEHASAGISPNRSEDQIIEKPPPTGAIDTTRSTLTCPSESVPGDTATSKLEIPAEERPRSLDIAGAAIYGEYYGVVVERILKPFFFASIGFSIPITRMFNGPIVWRGLVYTILMLLGKLLTGLWLVRISSPAHVATSLVRPLERLRLRCWGTRKPSAKNSNTAIKQGYIQENGTQSSSTAISNVDRSPKGRSTRHPKPLSLYPASILGAAMVSRGEIGFLIASVAQSKGIFFSPSEEISTASSDGSEIFLVVVWAITLCTILGPLSVGFLVRRVRALQKKQGPERPAQDPLGVWGIR